MVPARTRAFVALGALAATAVVSLGPAAPTHAEPSIDTVKTQVDRLYSEAEQAQERLNTAKIDLANARKDLGGLSKDERRQQGAVSDAKTQIADSIVTQYQGESVTNVAPVIVGETGVDTFVDRLTTLDEFNDIQAERVSDYSVKLAGLKLRSSATATRAAEAARIEKQAAADKKIVDEKFQAAQDLLNKLEAEERAALAAAQAPAPQAAPNSTDEPAPADPAVPEAPASGRASAAIQYAMAQVGKSYVYGAAGPSSFDCSGLTMRAWEQAGVSLPHSSSAQMSSGTPVSSSDLQPGDLVFYYSPVSHVALYIGDGKIVHAANPSSGVEVADVFMMPYSGAVRPG